jgi:hypothetical protein
MPEPAPRGDYLTSEEPTISNLEVESLRLANPPITYLSASILIQVVPSEVTPSECHLVLQVVMEVNVPTSSRSPHASVMSTIVGVILTPLPPSPVWTTVV